MSVLIKNTTMPKNCIECPMQFGGWCYVCPPDIDERVAETVEEAVKQGKPDWCPLVEIEGDDVAPVVHGHWIYGEDESGQDGYSCSECDFFVPWYYKYYEQGLHFIKDYHLCPQCGAKMDESEEGEP